MQRAVLEDNSLEFKEEAETGHQIKTKKRKNLYPDYFDVCI
jgi:hypothetical protein